MNITLKVDTAVEVPVNAVPLTDDTDFKTRETSIAYNASGMDLVWNFLTTAGVISQTAVTPTTGGVYDWVHEGDGMYSMEIPASGGASINNDTEGWGWFSGFVTGVLPFRGPTICFAPANVVDGLVTGSDNLQVDAVQIEGSDATDQINAACDTSIETYDLDKLFSAEIQTSDVADLSAWAYLSSSSGSANYNTFDNTSMSLQALASAIAAISSGMSPQLLQSTTIATLASQTSFTLTAGSADDDAYNGHLAIVTDQSTSTQKAVGIISDYTGSSKTITLDSDPGIFTMAVGDTIDIVAVNTASSAPTAAAIRAEIDSNSTQLAAIVADTNELQTNQGNWLTATGFSTHSAADVRSEIDSNSTQLTAIVADTNELQTNQGNWLTATGFSTHSAEDVRTEMDSNSTQLAAIVADTNELQSDDIPGILATIASYVDTEVAAIKAKTDSLTFTTANQVDANPLAINSSTAAAVRLALSAAQIIPATVDTATNSHTPTTTEFQADDITEGTDDHFNGRVVIFTSGNLANQATDITDYTTEGGIGVFTVTALTEAPSNNDTFIIV